MNSPRLSAHIVSGVNQTLCHALSCLTLNMELHERANYDCAAASGASSFARLRPPLMTSEILVRPVVTKADRQAFVDFAWEVYREDAAGRPDQEVAARNLDLVEALVRRTAVIDGWAPREGRLLRWEGRAGALQDDGLLEPPTPGLLPVGTELAHSVRYVEPTESGVRSAARLKEMRYARKTTWQSWSDTQASASDEAKEIGLTAMRKAREIGERRRERRAEKHNATQAALELAQEEGVDIDDVDGSGAAGRVTVRDVRQAAA
jgi:hypothetical protein